MNTIVIACQLSRVYVPGVLITVSLPPLFIALRNEEVNIFAGKLFFQTLENLSHLISILLFATLVHFTLSSEKDGGSAMCQAWLSY